MCRLKVLISGHRHYWGRRGWGVTSGSAVMGLNCHHLQVQCGPVLCRLSMFGSLCWAGNNSKFDRRLEKTVKKRNKTSRSCRRKAAGQFKDTVKKRKKKRLHQTNRNMNWSYKANKTRLWLQTQQQQLSVRFLLPKTNTPRYKASFLPSVLSVFNENYNRH